jgi:polar amino acid transport system substrate-binding protein
MIKKWIQIVAFFCVIPLWPLHAQKDTALKFKDIRVGIAGSAPFVLEDGEGLSGIVPEIWSLVADSRAWNYHYVYFGSVADALNAMEQDSVDLVAGPVTITSERAAYIDFSQPYYQASLGLLSRIDKVTLWNRVKPFFSVKLIYAIFVFLFILALVGTFLWLAERKASPEQFPRHAMGGIGTGMWLAIVTMSTTGYGDKAPITFWGRVIAGTWMVVSIIFATSMVAGIASTLTLTGLGNDTVNNIGQLAGKSVATVKDSPAEDFVEDISVKKVLVNNLSDAISALKLKKVDAVIYDRPQLMYYIKSKKETTLYLGKSEYYKQGYGFAFSKSSLIRDQFNVFLLEARERQKIDRITSYWLGSDE